MPYIKSKPVHTTVDKTLRYILNPDKCKMHLSGQPQSAHDARIQGCHERHAELLYLIAIGDLAYRVNKQGYSVLKTFTKSRAEKERDRQEELAREEQERTEAEERQREEEQKKKKEEETTKQVQHKTRNKLHL